VFGDIIDLWNRIRWGRKTVRPERKTDNNSKKYRAYYQDTDKKPEKEIEPKKPKQKTADDLLKEVDAMQGHAFENRSANLIRKSYFYDVYVTKGSGDQGIDVVGYKDEIKYGIQCKCYSSDLGNTPVQEVYAGKSMYDCHVAVVMTNRYFTTGAQELAKKTGVLLWDREKLRKMIEKVYV